MVLDKLGENLRSTFEKIKKAMFVDEKLVNELCKDLQRALLSADVSVKLVFELTKKIKERILKEEPPSGLSKKDYLTKIVYDELVAFLGEQGHKITISKKPFVILLVGLFGHGKTTQAGKLAKFFQKRGNKVAVIQTDTWRPAAYHQLQQLAGQLHVDFFGDEHEKNPVTIFKRFEPKLSSYDVVIVDTAGRDALNDELIQELNGIYAAVKPHEVLLVIGADVGQAAEQQAKIFHETCNVTGVVITKMDGTAKGGGSLTACAVTGAPVKFIGVGEKVDDLEEFDPRRFVGRLLGMGDIEALLEKANEAISKEQAEDLGKRLLKGEFTLVDLYEQMEAMSKMGPLGKVVEMIPGFSQIKMPKEALQVQEGKLKKWRYAMDSFTQEELEDPEIMDSSRISRVAKGAGLPEGEIRELLKQYKQSKKVVKMLKGGDERSMQQLMKKMQSGQVKMR